MFPFRAPFPWNYTARSAGCQSAVLRGWGARARFAPRRNGRGNIDIMGLQICVLASGSSGNCTLVRSAGTALLVDAGLSARETSKRLAAVGVRLEQIAGICI